LQHGQKIVGTPKELLCKMGFVVKDVAEGHLCCGSAGTYNILQPELARRLRERKVGNIEKLKPDVIAAGNIGCMTQIAAGTVIPVVHTVELIDWATGGPEPEALAGKRGSGAAVAPVAPAKRVAKPQRSGGDQWRRKRRRRSRRPKSGRGGRKPRRPVRRRSASRRKRAPQRKRSGRPRPPPRRPSPLRHPLSSHPRGRRRAAPPGAVRAVELRNRRDGSDHVPIGSLAAG